MGSLERKYKVNLHSTVLCDFKNLEYSMAFYTYPTVHPFKQIALSDFQ